MKEVTNLLRLSRVCVKHRYKVLANFHNGLLNRSLVASKTRICNVKLKSYQFRILTTTLPSYRRKDDEIIQTQDRIWTVPNALSLARISATPLLAYYIINLDFYPATGILVAASITDFIDGWIARSFKGQSSKLGSFLDPLADKLLIITLYGSMAYMHVIPGILMGLIVLRDVALLSAGVYIRFISIPPPRTIGKYFDHKHSAAQLSPTLLSKVNTAVQLVTALLSLYASANPDFPQDILIIAWYLAGFTTVSSGVSYIFAKNTYKIMKS